MGICQSAFVESNQFYVRINRENRIALKSITLNWNIYSQNNILFVGNKRT